MITRAAFALPVLLAAGACAAPPQLPPEVAAPVPTPSTASLRGLAIAAGDTLWAGGNGDVNLLRSLDGGRRWDAATIAGAEDLDFRDLHAFDRERVVALACGPGARSQVRLSDDGGRTWTTTLVNEAPTGFYDGFAFWPARADGLLLGDPVDGRFVIWRTTDGGRGWQRLPPERMPPARDGEHAFAASGTCIAAWGRDRAAFVTGGSVARIFLSEDGGASWRASELPLAHGSATAGAFGLAFADPWHGLAVGGDFERPDVAAAVCARTADGGRTWHLVPDVLGGYRSGVAAAGPHFVAVGPNGAELLDRSGWLLARLPAAGGHTVAAADAAGALVWVAGPSGRLFPIALAPR